MVDCNVQTPRGVLGGVFAVYLEGLDVSIRGIVWLVEVLGLDLCGLFECFAGFGICEVEELVWCSFYVVLGCDCALDLFMRNALAVCVYKSAAFSHFSCRPPKKLNPPPAPATAFSACENIS